MIWGYHDFWKHPYIVISNHPATGCYNNFSNHTSQHFKKKNRIQSGNHSSFQSQNAYMFFCAWQLATGNNNPPPPQINQLNLPQKKTQIPKACENILLDSSSHMSQLQWQGHRLPKTWRRRPGSSDPGAHWLGSFLVGYFFGGWF